MRCGSESWGAPSVGKTRQIVAPWAKVEAVRKRLFRVVAEIKKREDEGFSEVQHMLYSSHWEQCWRANLQGQQWVGGKPSTGRTYSCTLLVLALTCLL